MTFPLTNNKGNCEYKLKENIVINALVINIIHQRCMHFHKVFMLKEGEIKNIWILF